MTGINQQTILRRSDRVDETRIGDRIVLYHRDTGSGIVLNPSGTFIWETLAKPRSSDEVVDALLARHSDVAPEKIRQDVAAYVKSLKVQSLIDEV